MLFVPVAGLLYLNLTSVSVGSTADARVSVTFLPLIDGATALRYTGSSVPPDGVFHTLKALFARLAAAASSSLKVMTREVPSTAAELTALLLSTPLLKILAAPMPPALTNSKLLVLV